MRHKLGLIAKGFCMGAADVVPGVSGGTMALMLGIYAELIAAIRSFDFIWLRQVFRLDIPGALARPHFGFIIPLFVGLLGAVAVFTRVIPLPTLVHTHPEHVYGLFLGLIVSSIVVIMRLTPIVGITGVLQLVVGTICGWLVVTLVPTTTPETSWFVFLSGAVAISAMVLPGISGSFILLILGKYAYILDAVGHLKLAIIVPFVAGIVTGLILFSRFLSWVLNRWNAGTLRVITGFLIGSLWVIWPFQNRTYQDLDGKEVLVHSAPFLPAHFDATVGWSLGLGILGFTAVLIIERLARR